MGAAADDEDARELDVDALLGLSGDASDDQLYDQAVAIVAKDRKCSTSYIQRKLAIGYNPAARLVEQRLPDQRRGAGIHPPGRLRHHQQAGPALDLAPDDEFLQVAARQRLRRGVGTARPDMKARDQRPRLLTQLPCTWGARRHATRHAVHSDFRLK